MKKGKVIVYGRYRMNFLDKIREPKKINSVKREVVATLVILLFGICMGVFSKYLDYRQANLPSFFAGD